MKYLIVLFASLAMFSPLFLAGIRRYSGRKASAALGANIPPSLPAWSWPRCLASAAAPWPPVLRPQKPLRAWPRA